MAFRFKPSSTSLGHLLLPQSVPNSLCSTHWCELHTTKHVCTSSQAGWHCCFNFHHWLAKQDWPCRHHNPKSVHCLKRQKSVFCFAVFKLSCMFQVVVHVLAMHCFTAVDSLHFGFCLVSDFACSWAKTKAFFHVACITGFLELSKRFP